ncbi:MAG: alpha/beta hydrolase family protein [Promethearchaeota archaeon]
MKKTKFYKKKKHLILLIPLIFFTICLIFLYSNRVESYVYYERLNFQSSGTTIYADLYYPSHKLTFQEKDPLIIYAHGFGSQKDLDPRIPNEFTKRGFYVASIDYRGNGESSGHILDINRENYRNRTNVPAIAQDCSKLLDLIESLPVYEKINSSQIGLVGHSLGGMVALMNGALDDRFVATVTWAGLVNFSASFFGINNDHPFMNYIPAKIINETNPRNLLGIHSIYDETVPYKQNALILQKLTNCKLVNITQELFLGPHYLFSDTVIIRTINWFENIFFTSDIINGPIHLSYKLTLIFLGLSLIGLFFTTISIMIFILKYFHIKKEEIKYNGKSFSSEKIERRTILNPFKQTLKILFYFLSFLGIWLVFFLLLGITSLVITPIIMIIIYFVTILIKYYISSEKIGERLSLYIEFQLKKEIKSQFHKNVLLYSLLSAIIFLALYISFSISYPFAFFSPVNIISFIIAYTVYPFYLIIEIFYRKIIYPSLTFIRSPFRKILITNALSIINISILMVLSYPFFIINSILVSFLIFLAVMIMNSLIYEKTNKFSSVLISSFIIIQIFFGSAVSTILGIGPLIHLINL